MLEKEKTEIKDAPEHILVGLSSAPSNAKIVQTAAKMAKAFKGSFTALYVKTPNADSMSEEDKARLQNNIRLAERLGATVITAYGDDVSFQIAQYARLSGITKIVVGRSAVRRKKLFGKPTLTEQLISIAPNIDIHIIPDSTVSLVEQKTHIFDKEFVRFTLKDIFASLIILLSVTAFGYLFMKLGFTEANIITLYILGVLITSVVTKSKLCWVLTSVLSVLIFNFLFTAPHFSLLAYDKGYPVTFIIMLAASLISGSLADKMKRQTKQSSQAAYITKILFDANWLIQKAKSDEEIISVTTGQLKKLLQRKTLFFLPDGNHCRLDDVDEDCPILETSNQIVKWVIEQDKKAGVGTDNYPDEKYFYLPVSVNGKVYGVVAVLIDNRPIDSFEKGILQSIVGECALALESSFNAKEKELAAVLAKNEQLRANLLRAISHDLRTPLTAISGNASNLISNGKSFDEQTKLDIYKDIYQDSMWLIKLVENLLSVTRLEEGRMNINFTAELVDEVISEALTHVRTSETGHKIKVVSQDELLLAKMDARLIVQVIINVVDNAIKYTPSNSLITITAKKREEQVEISIADNGKGIPDDVKPRVFDTFYTGTNAVADSRRSLGLGLALCKAIINAHGGEIFVTDNMPNGAVFTFTLPIGEVEINE